MSKPFIGAYDVNCVSHVVGRQLLDAGFIPVSGDPHKAILFQTGKLYRVVGWFTGQPLNTSVQPYALEVYVHAKDTADAFSVGADRLWEIMAPDVQLLNWYVEEAK